MILFSESFYSESCDYSSHAWMSFLQVSSVTQTTATEKEVLSQLLQEKGQLQREQEDRIRNLTKLLVTSSNLVPVQRVNVILNKSVLLCMIAVLTFSVFEDA